VKCSIKNFRNKTGMYKVSMAMILCGVFIELVGLLLLYLTVDVTSKIIGVAYMSVLIGLVLFINGLEIRSISLKDKQ
jgi:hypothetical protein